MMPILCVNNGLELAVIFFTIFTYVLDVDVDCPNNFSALFAKFVKPYFVYSKLMTPAVYPTKYIPDKIFLILVIQVIPILYF